MKTLRNTIALLPLLTLAAACSDSGPDATPAPAEGDFHVMMSVLPSGSQSATPGSDAGSDAERAFDPDHIYFATYKLPVSGQTYDGDYMTFLKDGVTMNNKNQTGFETSEVDAAYYTPTWGPSVAARLPKSDYGKGFVVGFFSVPSNTAADNFTVQGKKLNADANFTLKWPATGTNPYWTPSEDKVNGVYNHIPMAGLVEVTEEEMLNYNPNVYTGVSPFRLPDVRPMRAMAKVVINDPEGLISKAEMTCPNKGYLFPDPAGLMTASASGDFTGVKPMVPTSASTFTQKIELSGGETAGKKFVFYSYEQSFLGSDNKPLDAAATEREIITLTSDPAKLHGEGNVALIKKISIAPYTAGAIDKTATLTDPDYNGSWQGLMRNRVYTYVIGTSDKFDLNITVSVEDWVKNTEDDEFKPVKDN